MNGKLNGPFKLYYENGQLKQEGSFKDNKEDGFCNFYYENGKLKREGKLGINEKEEGLWKYYHENGKLSGIGKWKKVKRMVYGNTIMKMVN